MSKLFEIWCTRTHFKTCHFRITKSASNMFYKWNLSKRIFTSSDDRVSLSNKIAFIDVNQLWRHTLVKTMQIKPKKQNNISRYCSKANNKNALSFFREKNEWNFFSRKFWNFGTIPKIQIFWNGFSFQNSKIPRGCAKNEEVVFCPRN